METCLLSAETIRPPATSDKRHTPALSYYVAKARVKFTGSCLKQPRVSCTHGAIVTIYIFYELSASSSHDHLSDDPSPKKCFLERLI